jgi:hypothetical protein
MWAGCQCRLRERRGRGDRKDATLGNSAVTEADPRARESWAASSASMFWPIESMSAVASR